MLKAPPCTNTLWSVGSTLIPGTLALLPGICRGESRESDVKLYISNFTIEEQKLSIYNPRAAI